MKLLGHIKRIAVYSGTLVYSLFKKATKGTSSAFKTAGMVVTGFVTAVLVTTILFMLGLVSVPIAVFSTPLEAPEPGAQSVNIHGTDGVLGRNKGDNKKGREGAKDGPATA